jgi:hypothetical protein
MRQLALLFAFALASFAHAAEGDATISTGVTVPAPAGYMWKKVNESEATDKSPKVEIFLASKEGSTAQLIMIVEHTLADNDPKKIARIKGMYNGVATTLQQQGYTDLKGSKPQINPPIPNRVGFVMQGKDKDGNARAFEAQIFFAKTVYQFQAAAPTPDEAKTLIKVAEQVKE